jgi:hypothetical protein
VTLKGLIVLMVLKVLVVMVLTMNGNAKASITNLKPAFELD